MTPLTAPARHALRTLRLARTRRYGKCAQCGTRIRTNRWQPSIDQTGPVMLHRRCVNPIRLAHRGQFALDFALALIAATLLTALAIAIAWTGGYLR